MRRIRLLLFLLLVAGAVWTPSHCQGEDFDDKDIKVVTGAICNLDWVGSKMAIDRIVELSHDQMVFTVPRAAKIYKGIETISFSDLHMWDRVKIEYYNDAPVGGLKVISITCVS